jgi:nucleoside-diphosphate-sugar epimerase
MKVAITGASGFVGSHLASKLLAAGHYVRAQHRRSTLPIRLQSTGGTLEPLRLAFNCQASSEIRQICRAAIQKLRTQDVVDLDTESFVFPNEWLDQAQQVCTGMDALVHVAASVSDWGSIDDFLQANAYVSLALLEQAYRQGMSRVVIISSISVHGFGSHSVSTEDGPYYPLQNPYPLSKRLVESLALSYRKRGLSVVVARPGNVYGPGDTTTFFPMFEAMEKGLMGTLGKGRYLTCPIHVDDLCQGIIAALESTLSDPWRYNFCSPELITWRELILSMARHLGVREPRANLPVPIARFAGAVMEGFAKLFGARHAPPLTAYRVWQLTSNYHFSTDLASKHLGWQSTVTLEDGMAQTVADYRKWQMAQSSKAIS